MTAQSKKIAEAIRALDLNDDSLWTQDGLPRINVVVEAVGIPGLTRADITEAGSGLDRESLRAAAAPTQGEQEGVAEAEATRNPKTDGTTGAPTENHPEESNQNPPVPVTEKAVPPEEDRDPPVGDVDAQPDTSLEGPFLELKKAQDLLEQRRAELNEAQLAFNRQSAEVDHWLDETARAEPIEKPMDSIQFYLESQKRQREQKAARARELREAGVNIAELQKAINTRSQLDQAMARKNQRGATRPGGKA